MHFSKFSIMADAGEKVLEVLLNKKDLFMVMISHSGTIRDLCDEIEKVAREEFGEKGQVTVLETKQGARLPERYKVGNLLKNEHRIMAYSSECNVSSKRKRKLPHVRATEEGLHKPKRKRKEKSDKRLPNTIAIATTVSESDSNLGHNSYGNGKNSKGKSFSQGTCGVGHRQTRSTVRGINRLCGSSCNKLYVNLRQRESDNYLGDESNAVADDESGTDKGILNCSHREHADSDIRHEKESMILSANNEEGVQSCDDQSDVDNEYNEVAVDGIKRKLSFSVYCRRQGDSGATCHGKESSTASNRDKSKKVKETLLTKQSCADKSDGKCGDKSRKGSNLLKSNHHSEDSNGEDSYSESDSSSLSDNVDQIVFGNVDLSDYEGPVLRSAQKQTKNNIQHKSSVAENSCGDMNRRTNDKPNTTPKCRKEKSINKQHSQDNRRLPLGIGKNVQIRVSPLSTPNKPRRLKAKEQMSLIKKSSGGTLDKPREKGQTNQIERTTELNQGNPERSQTGEKTYQKDTVQESENAFIRIFLDDMRELQCESKRDDDSTKKSLGQRGRSNTGAIVLSPLRSPERRSQRRKEEIHKSTSKVADWLSTHDISTGINSNATETCQTEPGCEAPSKRVISTRTTARNRSREASKRVARSDDNCDTCCNEGNERGSADSVSSDRRMINGTSLSEGSPLQGRSEEKTDEGENERSMIQSILRQNNVNRLTSERPPESSAGPRFAGMTKQCLVKVQKLPVRKQNGELKVVPLQGILLNEHSASCFDEEGDKTFRRTYNPGPLEISAELKKAKTMEVEIDRSEIQGKDEGGATDENQTIDNPPTTRSPATQTKTPSPKPVRPTADLRPQMLSSQEGPSDRLAVQSLVDREGTEDLKSKRSGVPLSKSKRDCYSLLENDEENLSSSKNDATDSDTKWVAPKREKGSVKAISKKRKRMPQMKNVDIGSVNQGKALHGGTSITKELQSLKNSRCEMGDNAEPPANLNNIPIHVDRLRHAERDVDEGRGATKEELNPKRGQQSREDQLPSSKQEAAQLLENQSDFFLNGDGSNREVQERPGTEKNRCELEEDRNVGDNGTDSTACESDVFSEDGKRHRVEKGVSKDKETMNIAGKRQKCSLKNQENSEMVKDNITDGRKQGQQSKSAQSASGGSGKNGISTEDDLSNRNSRKGPVALADRLVSRRKESKHSISLEPLPDIDSVLDIQERESESVETFTEDLDRKSEPTEDHLNNNLSIRQSTTDSVDRVVSGNKGSKQSSKRKERQGKESPVTKNQKETESIDPVDSNSSVDDIADRWSTGQNTVDSVGLPGSRNGEFGHSNVTEQVQDVDSNVSAQEQQYDSKATSREYLGKGDRRTINSLHNSNKKQLQDSVAVVSEKVEISSSEATVMASSSQKGKIARTNFHLNNKERLEHSDSVVSQQEEISDSEATATTKSRKNDDTRKNNLHSSNTEQLQSVVSDVLEKEQISDAEATARSSSRKNGKTPISSLHSSNTERLQHVDYVVSEQEQISDLEANAVGRSRRKLRSSSTEQSQGDTVLSVHEEDSDSKATAAVSSRKNDKTRKNILQSNSSKRLQTKNSLHSNKTEQLQDVGCVVSEQEEILNTNATANASSRKNNKTGKNILQSSIPDQFQNFGPVVSVEGQISDSEESAIANPKKNGQMKNRKSNKRDMESLHTLKRQRETTKHSNNTEMLEGIDSAVFVEEKEPDSEENASSGSKKNDKTKNSNKKRHTESLHGRERRIETTKHSNNTKVLQCIDSAVFIKEKEFDSEATASSGSKPNDKATRNSNIKRHTESFRELERRKEITKHSDDTEQLHGIILEQGQETDSNEISSGSDGEDDETINDNISGKGSSTKRAINSFDGQRTGKGKSKRHTEQLVDVNSGERVPTKQQKTDVSAMVRASRGESSRSNRDHTHNYRDSSKTAVESVDRSNGENEKSKQLNLSSFKKDRASEKDREVLMERSNANAYVGKSCVNNKDGSICQKQDVSSSKRKDSRSSFDDDIQTESEKDKKEGDDSEARKLPLQLAPFKEGKHIVWMRERTKQKADDVTGHAKAIKRHYMTAEKSAVQSEDSSQSENENTAVGRSQTFVKTNESKANVSALNGETGLEKGQSTITEKDVSDTESDLENRVEGIGKIIQLGCDKGSDMAVNGTRETDEKTHAPKRKAANKDNSQFPENSGNYTCNEEGPKRRKISKNKYSLSEIEQKESNRESSDEEIADCGVEERNEDNSQFPEHSGNHTCHEEGAKKRRKRKNKDSLSEAKRKEGAKDSIAVEIADSRVEEKNYDYSQFPDNSGNHTYNEEGAKKRKQKKNKDSLSETEQKESKRDSSDEEMADDGMEEKNEGNSQFPENSGSHTCNEEGAKRSRKKKNIDLLSEAKQKESDRDSSDEEIAVDDMEEKKEEQSQVVKRSDLYRTENEKKRKKKKKKKSSKNDSPTPQTESGLRGVPEEKWKMEESVDFGTIKEIKKGKKERSSKPEEEKEKKRKKKKKEKRRQSESPTSLNDSGYRTLTEVKDEMKESDEFKKDKGKEKCGTDPDVLTQVWKQSSEHTQQKPVKKKKAKLLSLLDLAQDAEQKSSSTAENNKTLSTASKQHHNLKRHFRQTPKGFIHTVKNRKLSASTSTVHVRRKPRANPKENLQFKGMAAKEKDMIARQLSFEELLNDDSFWNT